MSLHHLALGAQDVEALASFYEQGFHLKRLTTHHDEQEQIRSIWLACGAFILMIEAISPGHSLETIGEGVSKGPFLLAFDVEPEQRAAKEMLLQSLGAVIESRSDYTSYARDPEGNRVAISHYPHPPAP